jgi:hypothetical protein
MTNAGCVMTGAGCVMTGAGFVMTGAGCGGSRDIERLFYFLTDILTKLRLS